MTDSVYGEVVVVRCDGDVSVQLLDTSDSVLDQLYAWTGARTVEPVTLADDLEAWFDEDGFAYERPVNFIATLILREHGLVSQIYVGTAVFARTDADGNTVGLTPESVDSLLTSTRRAIQHFEMATEPDPRHGSDTSRKESL